MKKETRIAARMFQRVIDPRFVVSEKIGDARGLFLMWDMRFRMKSWKPRQPQIIRGVSHLRFGEDGKVTTIAIAGTRARNSMGSCL